MNMKRAHTQHIISRAAWLCMLICICFGAGEYARAEDSPWDKFVPPPDDKFDWIQLTSGEWLKGELKFLYDFQVEFDSKKLDLLTFDLEDVKQIRTHKPHSISIDDRNLSDKPIIVEGVVTLIDNKVIMTVGDETREFERSQIISIAKAREKKERELWSASITLGANIRGGNTETVDSNLQINLKRLTATSRLVFDYIGNYSEADKSETSNNHRLSGYRDLFLSKKFFWRQLTGEYYRDRFKNIDNQLSLSTGVGYHIIYTPKTKWEISGGIGGRYTKFVSVEPGQSADNISPALGVGTLYDTKITEWMDFLVDYDFQIVNEDAGSYTHHFVTTLSTDLIKGFDFDFSFVWDRIGDPQPDSDSNIPKQDDYQFIFGLNYKI
jgi:putative salt-induced outer membrane protein YdiY